MKKISTYCCGSALIILGVTVFLFIFAGNTLSEALGLDFSPARAAADANLSEMGDAPDIALTDEPYELDLTDPSPIQLAYITDDIATCVNLPWGLGDWNRPEDPLTGEGSSFIACGSPAVEWPDPVTIKRTANTDSIQLQFLLEPDSYTVTRWPKSAAAQYDLYDQLLAPIETPDDTITLEEDGVDYVYQVDVVYPYGNITYGFYVPAI